MIRLVCFSIFFTAAALAIQIASGYSTDSYSGSGDIEDTPSPNEPIPKPECDTSNPVSVRYSSTTGRLYVETAGSTRGGCVTIDQIWEARGGGTDFGAKAPLYAVDPDSGDISETITGTWLLFEDLYVEDGVTLRVRSMSTALYSYVLVPWTWTMVHYLLYILWPRNSNHSHSIVQSN